MLQLLKRNEIDSVRWDACISKAHNGLIYARTYYLDAMAENWCGIVTSDYSAVMPLPFKKKYGVRYIYTPPFVQQLGIFSISEIARELLLAFIAIAKQHFKFADYYFNYKNEDAAFSRRINYVLALNNNYDEIKKFYQPDLNRALKKNLQCTPTFDYKKAIQLSQQLYAHRNLHITKRDYEHFSFLCQCLQQKNELTVREVTNANNEILSTAICLKDARRLYFIMSATTIEGRAKSANYLLIDNLIKEYTTQNILLDFEGSDIEGIAHFYKNFGSTNQPYFFYHWNNLPWPMRILKS